MKEQYFLPIPPNPLKCHSYPQKVSIYESAKLPEDFVMRIYRDKLIEEILTDITLTNLEAIKRSVKDFNVCNYKNLRVKGVNIWDYKNLNNENFLHFAVRTGDIEIIKYLVQKGVDFKAANNENETPIEIARKLENTEITRYFHTYENAPLNQMDSPRDSTFVGVFFLELENSRQNISADSNISLSLSGLTDEG